MSYGKIGVCSEYLQLYQGHQQDPGDLVDPEDPATNKHPKEKVSDYGIWNEIKSKYRDNPICMIKVY